MLLPVAGIIQAGDQAYADRYTYLPQIGIYVALTWLAAEWSAKHQVKRVALGGLMIGIIGALMFCAWKQTGYWQDTETLWNHTLACTTGNYMARDDLGNLLRKEGRVDEAIAQYQEALQIKTNYAAAHYNLGIALRQTGRLEEAIAQYREALQCNPSYADADVDLGAALLDAGRLDEAIAYLQKALQLNPASAKAHNDLGNVFLQKGDTARAAAHFRQAVQINPADPWVKNNLAWLLATSPQASQRDGKTAVDLARQAEELTGEENPIILRTLAAALAEAGRFSEALETAQQGLQSAQAQSNAELSGQFQAEMKLFQAGKPFRTAGALGE